MESPVPLSPSALDFEGFTEAEAVKYRDNTISHNGQMFSKVVHTTKYTAYSNINLRSNPTADSGQQNREGPEDF